ncbi:type I 3-dehydroquinate dehydratase [Mesobacillus maritimus]|uniref:type I 3-dehydroquinate dehydratase n=1 Tax=Mesobacillus maritimus TaxID=1643336 RepID=UPI00203A84BE|nr:type I 3-dehydroquinate dehydratase [Mesobacillus maritimus]MCM3586207.1 type I 3-dehydroquinate dehydratase [Mesobacillus maritimus]MCM3667534.1 type I 3-dehydroquinate dehydratase [Mesobacillus maritimus]
MKKTLAVKGITIGEGRPKVCVPMIGSTYEELMKEAERLSTLDIDLVEWRVDFFESVNDIEQVIQTLTKLRSILAEVPVIFTFRTAREGGEREIAEDEYSILYEAIMDSGLVDIVDIELFLIEDQVKELIEFAHARSIYVILSNHDFEKTPTKTEIITRLQKAQELGADIPKIAVMPIQTADVLTLLEASLEMVEQYADRPIITMSMSGIGMISRLVGETFGSAITFGTTGKESAPGQIAVEHLRTFLDVLHKGL